MSFTNLFNGSFDSYASDAITGVTGAVADLSTAGGYDAEKASYQKAASLAEQNKTLQATSTQIQLIQTQRQIAQVQGAAEADIGAAGLTEGGSAGDIIAANQQQGALQTQLLKTQGLIAETGYEAQAQSYTGLSHQAGAAASAARASAAGSAAKGFLGIVGAIASVASLFV